MLNNFFRGIFDTEATAVISVTDFMMCVICSLVIGLILAVTFMYKSRYSKSFVLTLALLPAIVCIVIMMVNGNIGTGVAVAGAFSLVRFRSAPGTAKEIGSLFIAMSAGLIGGMGYLAYAVLFTMIMCIMLFLYNQTGFGKNKNDYKYKTLRITIPEDLDYTGVFNDIFDKYTTECDLISVKTSNMGSLYKLTYNITFNTNESEKEMIDILRCRNGNLEISVSHQETPVTEL